MLTLRTCLVSLFALWSTVSMAQDFFQFTPIPDWVVPHQPTYPDHFDYPDFHDRHMLVKDIQHHVPQRATFYHFEYKIFDGDGVFDNYRIEFDPLTETVAVHSVAVVREGTTQEQVPGIRWTANYEGRADAPPYLMSAADIKLHVRDMRPGDFVKVQYTIWQKETAQPMPFHRTHNLYEVMEKGFGQVRVLSDPSAPLLSQASADLCARRLADYDGLRQEVWSREGTGVHSFKRYGRDNVRPAYNPCTSCPEGHSPFQTLYLSEAQTWPQLAAAVRAWFPTPAIQALQWADSVMASAETQEEALLSVLEFMGAEVGYKDQGLHPGTPAELVWRWKKGHSLDQVALTQTMLARLGIDSWPVLVHTRRQALYDFQEFPSLEAFNHMVLAFDLGGHTYYFDPLKKITGLSIHELVEPEYGLGLSLLPNGTTWITFGDPYATPSTQLDSLWKLTEGQGNFYIKSHITFRGERAVKVRNWYETGGSTLVYSQLNQEATYMYYSQASAIGEMYCGEVIQLVDSLPWQNNTIYLVKQGVVEIRGIGRPKLAAPTFVLPEINLNGTEVKVGQRFTQTYSERGHGRYRAVFVGGGIQVEEDSLQLNTPFSKVYSRRRVADGNLIWDLHSQLLQEQFRTSDLEKYRKELEREEEAYVLPSLSIIVVEGSENRRCQDKTARIMTADTSYYQIDWIPILLTMIPLLLLLIGGGFWIYSGWKKRRFRKRALLLGWLLASLAGEAAFGQIEEKPTEQLYAPTPDWVIEHPVPTLALEKNNTPPRSTVLVDDQVHIPLGQRFTRYAIQLHTEGGVFQYYTIPYDPDQQEIRIHNITIVGPDGPQNVTQKVAATTRQVVQGTEGNIYKQEVSLYLDVGDYLTPGAVFDISFSRVMKDPEEVEEWQQDYPSLGPGLKGYFRVVFSGDAPHVIHNGDDHPSKRDLEGYSDWRWTLKRRIKPQTSSTSYPFGIAPIVSDGDKFIKVSRYTSWDEVAQSHLLHYPRATQLSPIELEQYRSITKEIPEEDTLGRLTALAHFVQNDLGYLTNGGYVPLSGRHILTCGYGDCKGKTKLLMDWFRRAGVAAWPVLVHNEGLSPSLLDFPSGFEFNHVILEYELKGERYFFDATLTDQMGSITERFVPDYSYGLRIKDGEVTWARVGQNPGQLIVRDSVVHDTMVGTVVRSRQLVATGGKADFLRGQLRVFGWDKLKGKSYIRHMLGPNDWAMDPAVSIQDLASQSINQILIAIKDTVSDEGFFESRINEGEREQSLDFFTGDNGIFDDPWTPEKRYPEYWDIPENQAYIRMPTRRALDYQLMYSGPYKLFTKRRDIQYQDSLFTYSLSDEHLGDTSWIKLQMEFRSQWVPRGHVNIIGGLNSWNSELGELYVLEANDSIPAREPFVLYDDEKELASLRFQEIKPVIHVVAWVLWWGLGLVIFLVGIRKYRKYRRYVKSQS